MTRSRRAFKQPHRCHVGPQRKLCASPPLRPLHHFFRPSSPGRLKPRKCARFGARVEACFPGLRTREDARVCTYAPLGSAQKTDGRFLVFPEYTGGGRNKRTQGLRRSKITRAAASSSPSAPRYARTRLLLPWRFCFSTGDGSAGPLGLIGVI